MQSLIIVLLLPFLSQQGYFDPTDQLELECFPDADSIPDPLVASYRYYGNQDRPLPNQLKHDKCVNWLQKIRTEKGAEWDERHIKIDQGKEIDEYSDHNKCRRIFSIEKTTPIRGPFCYVLTQEGTYEPLRCFPDCQGNRTKDKRIPDEKPPVPVPQQKVNYNTRFSEIGQMFRTNKEQKKKRFTHPSDVHDPSKTIAVQRETFEWCMVILAAVLILLFFFAFLGKRASKKRQRIAELVNRNRSRDRTRVRRTRKKDTPPTPNQATIRMHGTPDHSTTSKTNKKN